MYVFHAPFKQTPAAYAAGVQPGKGPAAKGSEAGMPSRRGSGATRPPWGAFLATKTGGSFGSHAKDEILMFLDVSDDCTSIFSRNEENYFSKNFKIFSKILGNSYIFMIFANLDGFCMHLINFRIFSRIFIDFR